MKQHKDDMVLDIVLDAEMTIGNEIEGVDSHGLILWLGIDQKEALRIANEIIEHLNTLRIDRFGGNK